MDDWKPKLNPSVDLTRLPLSPEEGFVLSRLDGATPVKSLTALTGFNVEKVRGILERLTTLGALDGAGAPTPVPSALPAKVDAEPMAEIELGAEDEAPPDAADEPEGEESPTHRALFESELHGLSANDREARARGATEPYLSAFCFDPLPAVIKALLENAQFGLAHARLVARHHRNPVGLEALTARAAFGADLGVRRWLVRNPQLPAGVFRRLFAGQRMLVQHKLSVDRDVAEGARRLARELLRQRFATGPAEERVELILKTEGRALAGLTGLAIDSKTTVLLCARPMGSITLIQNLARWSAAPPPLIAHLLRQELVRRQPQLRAMLQRHPNAPSPS